MLCKMGQQLTYCILVMFTAISYRVGAIHRPVSHGYYPGPLCTIFRTTCLLNESSFNDKNIKKLILKLKSI